MLSQGHTPENILEELLGGLEPVILEKKPVSYNCDCSYEKVERSLLSLNKKDLLELCNEGKPIEVHCDFCNKTYQIKADEIPFNAAIA